jgi:hypothetical protein
MSRKKLFVGASLGVIMLLLIESRVGQSACTCNVGCKATKVYAFVNGNGSVTYNPYYAFTKFHQVAPCGLGGARKREIIGYTFTSYTKGNPACTTSPSDGTTAGVAGTPLKQTPTYGCGCCTNCDFCGCCCGT